jgi:hypothetical protein
MVGPDPDRHEVAVRGSHHRLLHASAEALGIHDDVVGGERPEHRLRIARLQHRGGPPDRGHGVAR